MLAEIEETYTAQLKTLKEKIKGQSGPCSEKLVVEELFKILHIAVLRMQTCQKFSLDKEAELEIENKI